MGCVVELGHNVLRRAFRQEESRPSHDIVVRDTLLVRGRKLRHQRRSLARQQREGLRLLCGGTRHRVSYVSAHIIDVAADQVVRGRPATSLRDAGLVEAYPRGEERASTMRRRCEYPRDGMHL